MDTNVKDTLDAILLTKNIPYIDGVKIDVFMSKDGILVTAMDNDLSKFTLSKKKINEENYSYLKKVKFPSHIFKYYLPKLSDVLDKYDSRKIIILELHEQIDNEKYLSNLLGILNQYYYQYYFLIDENYFYTIKHFSFFNKDNLLFKKKVKYADNNSFLEGLNKNDIVITSCPKKIYSYLHFDKNRN